jgi:glutamate carboxypeptidase
LVQPGAIKLICGILNINDCFKKGSAAGPKPDELESGTPVHRKGRMEDLIQEIRKKVQGRRLKILTFIEELVSINSYSRNYEGINLVGELVRRNMPACLDHDVTIDRNGVSHHLFSTGVEQKDHNLVLLGHTDTVFPPGSDSRKYEDSGERIFGAGITDMKAGVAVIVSALNILDEMNLLKLVPVKCLINGDEEIGSLHSQPMIRELSKWASFGLVFEGGGRGGEVVYARRGIRRFKLIVTGEAQHAGVWEGPKASAILELSRMIQALETLNDRERGVSLNVGQISGGTTTNVIPDNATASFEYRFWDGETEEQTLSSINEIVNNPENPRCSASVSCHHRRPAASPLKDTDTFYTMIRDTARELGQDIGKESRGGTSDANFLVEGGVPTLDGMGPAGALDHSSEECIIKGSLFQRIELLALLMAKQFRIKKTIISGQA